MSEQMKDNKNIKQLLNLMEQNPELEVIAQVDGEIYLGEEYSWYAAEFGSSEVAEYYVPDMYYLVGTENILDYLRDSISKHEFDEDISESQYDEMINKELEKKRLSGEIEKAIFINIVNR